MINYFEVMRILGGTGLDELILLGYHLDMWIELRSKSHISILNRQLNPLGLQVGNSLFQTFSNTYVYKIDNFIHYHDSEWILE